jgi:hypothetical protein
MGEIDNNCNKWKIEYRLWDDQCPIYIGKIVDVKLRSLIKHGIGPLIHECDDSNFFV